MRISLQRERPIIVGTLLAVATISWIWLIRASRMSQMDIAVDARGLGAFIVAWIIMMVAMMLPTVLPMVLAFIHIHAVKRLRGDAFVPTWVFISGYLVVWTAFGIVSYVMAMAINNAILNFSIVHKIVPQLIGMLIIVAGVYQFTPLKRLCLSKCRTPVDFILGSWRDGYGGSFRMGIEHGSYCLGCCWPVFLILFPLGLMDLSLMILLTLFIFAEKTLPWAPVVSFLSGSVMMLYGGLTFFAILG